MKLIGTGQIIRQIEGVGILKNKILGSGRLKSLAPTTAPCTPYDLIDGGAPDTVYTPINGFNLIDGGSP